MRLRKYKGDHHVCTLLSLTSSKLMIPSQGASCGNIYKTVRCQIALCLSRKTYTGGMGGMDDKASGGWCLWSGDRARRALNVSALVL
eukprot:1142043-Pelagomonas_calceolata.AAC.1